MGGGLGRVTKHPDYYLSDGSVSFLAGNTLFRVHRSFLERESEVFRCLLASAAEDDPESGTDARPFTLTDVTADEFAQLLWVWYDGEYSYGQQTKENWITILRLSKQWAFPKIRDLAVRELDALDLSPAQRISIYNEHGIEGDRLLSSYVELCRSPTLPSQADGNLLRMETLINLLQAREDAQRTAIELGHETPTSASLEDETLREIVTRAFRTGLAPRPNGASTRSEVQANLNGERTRGTSSRETITVAEPQVPDRRAQSASGPSSHATGSKGKGNQEKEQGAQAESNDPRKVEKPRAGEGVNKRKPAEVAQDKEREEKEKREKEKEREEKEKEEKARQAKETEEKEKAEKAKEAKKEEEAKKKADEQKPWMNYRRRP